MSVLLMSKVWALDLDHSQQSLLLALADHAKDDGSDCFPGVGYLAWKTGYSERQVQRILRELESNHLIKPLAHGTGGRHLRTEYQLLLENGVKKSPFTVQKGDNMSRERVTKPAERVTSETQKGDKPGLPYKEEPSWEPSVESSEGEGGASARPTLCPNCRSQLREGKNGSRSVFVCLKCNSEVKVTPVDAEKEAKLKSDTGKCLKFYEHRYRERFNDAPYVTEGKDFGILRRVVEKYGKERTQDFLSRYIRSDDEKVKEAGFSIPFFPSQINSLIAEEKGHGRKKSLAPPPGKYSDRR